MGWVPTHCVGGEEGGLRIKCERWAASSATPNGWGQINFVWREGDGVSLCSQVLHLPLGVPPTAVPAVLHTKSYPRTRSLEGATATSDVGNVTQSPGGPGSVERSMPTPLFANLIPSTHTNPTGGTPPPPRPHRRALFRQTRTAQHCLGPAAGLGGRKTQCALHGIPAAGKLPHCGRSAQVGGADLPRAALRRPVVNNGRGAKGVLPLAG